jgi:Flp pilus assembly protein TadG
MRRTRTQRATVPVLRPAIRGRARGQSLAEFALVLPIFVVLLIGMIEFAFAFNAVLSVSFATREAALIAAEAGNGGGADCVILKRIDDSISAPTYHHAITEVRIYKADSGGAELAANVYSRSGSMTCTFPTGSMTVPYALVGTAAYPDFKRCNVLAGCPAYPPLPSTSTVDRVGVSVSYAYTWRTPLSGLLELAGSGYTIVKSISMRMEPVL